MHNCHRSSCDARRDEIRASGSRLVIQYCAVFLYASQPFLMCALMETREERFNLRDNVLLVINTKFYK